MCLRWLCLPVLPTIACCSPGDPSSLCRAQHHIVEMQSWAQHRDSPGNNWETDFDFTPDNYERVCPHAACMSFQGDRLALRLYCLVQAATPRSPV